VETDIQLKELIIAIKGAGEMASAAAWRLYMANLRSIFMMETAMPLAVRREVSFCEAVHRGSTTVEGVEALRASGSERFQSIWDQGNIVVTVDAEWNTLRDMRPDVLVDAILAKKNLGTRTNDAPLVIGLGPGFVAGEDVHCVIETQRGTTWDGSSRVRQANTGVPRRVDGIAAERMLRSPADGKFLSSCRIGDSVEKGDAARPRRGHAGRRSHRRVLRG
jgi:xanthine dehydrogenase accessory factor